MRTRVVLAFVVLFAWNSVGKAGIINLCGRDDGDLSVSCTGTVTYPDSTTGVLTLKGTQSGATGHIVGEFDTNGDPTIKYINAINNETDFAWTGYVVNYTLKSTKLITSGSLSLASPAVTPPPSDWSGTINQQISPSPAPALVGGYYEYTGQITYTGGTPILPGSDLYFTYSLSNLVGAPSGSTHYIYQQEMMPVSVVPEPASLTLLGIAGLGALVHVWRRRRAT